MKRTEYNKVYKFEKNYKNDEEFTAVKTVIKAASTDKTRIFINGVRAEKERIIATDGRRLHFINNNNLLDEGFYHVLFSSGTKIVLVKSDEKIDYPDYNRVIPDKKNMINCQALKGLHSPAFFISRVISESKCYVNYKYLEDVPVDDYELWYHEDDDTKPIMLCGKTLTAVIMPIQK